jgi:hypothetical protein
LADVDEEPHRWNVLLAISGPESEIVAALGEDPPGNPFRSTHWTLSPLQGFFPEDANGLHPVAGPCATGNGPGDGGLFVDQPASGFFADGILLAAHSTGQSPTRDSVFYIVERPDEFGEFEVAGPAFGSDFVLPAGTLGCLPGQGFGHE